MASLYIHIKILLGCYQRQFNVPPLHKNINSLLWPRPTWGLHKNTCICITECCINVRSILPANNGTWFIPPQILLILTQLTSEIFAPTRDQLSRVKFMSITGVATLCARLVRTLWMKLSAISARNKRKIASWNSFMVLALRRFPCNRRWSFQTFFLCSFWN